MKKLTKAILALFLVLASGKCLGDWTDAGWHVWNGEPYAVQLYVRNTNGGWRFYYVDHEVWPWRHGGQIDFSDGKVCVFCGEELFRVLDIDEENGSESERYPNYMTAEEVFNSCRYNRNRKGLTK